MAPKLDLEETTPADFDRARLKARRDPESLTEADVAVLEHYGGRNWRNNAFFGQTPSPASRSEATEVERLSAEVARLSDGLDAAYDIIEKLLDGHVKLKAFAIQMNEQNKVRNAKIAALESRPGVRDAGVWESGHAYSPGDIVTYNGSGWICRHAHVSVGNSPQADVFRLFVKHGKDAR